MKKMFLYFFITLALFAIVIFSIRFFSSEDAWICKDGTWTKHGNPSSPQPQGNCEIEKQGEQKENCSIDRTKQDPVCGENHKTYFYGELEAKCDNTEVLYKGECDKMSVISCARSDFSSREECKKIMAERIEFENYVRNNISELSPEKEVLGGKFYVTKIEWADDNNGIVEYEDGHIVFKAKFNIAMEGSGVFVYFFEIIKE